MQQTHRAMARGFTLIELLVVISIVVLLIAILLPALSKARQTASRLQCLSHLRALMPATVAYASDAGGYGPPHSFAHTRTDGQLLPSWRDGRDASPGFLAMSGLDPYFGYNTATPNTSRFYYRNRGCPDRQQGVQTHDPAFTMNHWILGLVGQTGDPDGSNTRNKWLNLDDGKIVPSNTMIALEHNRQEINGLPADPALHITLFDQPRSGGGFNQFGRHNGEGLNFLYVDGHGSFLSHNGTSIDNLPIIWPN